MASKHKNTVKPAKRKPSKKPPAQEDDVDLISYVKGLSNGRQEAEKKARNEIILRTPQGMMMGTPEGDAWLNAPEHVAARRAHDVVSYYFMLACILGKAKGSTKSDREWAAMEVLQCTRSWALPPTDTATNRLTVFLASFVRTFRQYESTRAIWTSNIEEEYLPKDPRQAELRRQEIQHRRDHELLPKLAPDLAQQAEQEFLRLYPDERDKIDVAKLAEAVEAFGLDGKRPGRKPKGKTSKYDLLAEAIRGTSFASEGMSLKAAIRQATKREDERRERTRVSEKSRLSETWEPPTFGKSNDEENDDE